MFGEWHSWGSGVHTYALYSGKWLRIRLIAFDDVWLHFQLFISKIVDNFLCGRLCQRILARFNFGASSRLHHDWRKTPKSHWLSHAEALLPSEAFGVEDSDNWCAKTRVWEGLQFAIPSMLPNICPLSMQMWKQMLTGSSCPSYQAWPLVVCGEGQCAAVCTQSFTRVQYMPSTQLTLDPTHRRCFHAPPASYTPIWLVCRQECQVELIFNGSQLSNPWQAHIRQFSETLLII